MGSLSSGMYGTSLSEYTVTLALRSLSSVVSQRRAALLELAVTTET